MSEQTSGSASASPSLPDDANLEWLKKQAKRKLAELRKTTAKAKLADAQFDLARQYGFSSWRTLKAHIDSLTVDAQLFDAAKKGDATSLGALLDAHQDKLHIRAKPYEHTLLHAAAQAGQLATVDLLLRRGLSPNVKEKGDDTYPMHWAAAAGNLEVVRRLADAGGDVVGHGDDHGLEVIGWATCWDGCDDAQHRAVADFLVSRGARHHIYSAIAMRLGDEVRGIVARDPSALSSRMSRNEDNQLPLHFAVRMNRPDMVALLIELGADPLGVDAAGYPAAMQALTPDADRPVMRKISAMTAAELDSAARGNRAARVTTTDLLAALAVRDFETAERVWMANHEAIERGGALHLMSKRGDAVGVKWLLDHGANPGVLWAHWDADVTPLHMAAWSGSTDVARLLLQRGADPTIKDSKHDSDALGWAEFFGRVEVVRILRSHTA